MPLVIIFEKNEIYNFADDNTIYDYGEDLSNILENLKHDMKIYNMVYSKLFTS